MILDTTFLIDFSRGNQKTVIKLIELEKYRNPIMTTSINVYEIMQGIKNKKEHEIAKKLFSKLEILPFNSEAAYTAGEIQKELRKKGEIIDSEDIMIAGIAITQNKIIITKNTKYFSKIKDIKIESY